jgi:hypothetical protein
MILQEREFLVFMVLYYDFKTRVAGRLWLAEPKQAAHAASEPDAG